MDARKSFDKLADYLRSVRPQNEDYLEFDRIVRLTLAWFDAHPRLRKPEEFAKGNGKEFQSYLDYLTSRIGHAPDGDYFSLEFVLTLKGFAASTR